jgi:nicotinamidase-related amidase
MRTLLIDINTQKSLFFAEGGYCIRNHRRVLARIRRIMAWARSNRIATISICRVHPDGVNGQEKISYTLLNNRFKYPAISKTDLARDLLRSYRQVILTKRCLDPFDEPLIDRLLSEVRASRFILIGAALEGAVKLVALGLLQRGKKTVVVTDAVGIHNRKEANLTLRKLETKGAKLVKAEHLAGSSHLKQVGICHCLTCQEILATR